ncbi:hypothetical protein V1504DRAFT_450529 [Lipomyces starkeyi]
MASIPKAADHDGQARRRTGSKNGDDQATWSITSSGDAFSTGGQRAVWNREESKAALGPTNGPGNAFTQRAKRGVYDRQRSSLDTWVRGQSGTGVSPSWREPSHFFHTGPSDALSTGVYLRDYLFSHWVLFCPEDFPTLVQMDVPFYRFSYRFSLGDLYICEHSYSSSGANCCVLSLVSLPSGLARWHAGRDHQISAFCS